MSQPDPSPDCPPPAPALTVDGPKSSAPPVGRRKIRGRGLVNWFSVAEQKSPGAPCKVSLEDVQKHNTHDDCWMIVKGAVYDVTEFISFHPGGAAIMMPYAGKDCTSAFIKHHHWIDPHGLLENYYIGQCCGVSAKGPKAPGLQHARTHVPAVEASDVDAVSCEAIASALPKANPRVLMAAQERAEAQLRKLAEADEAEVEAQLGSSSDSDAVDNDARPKVGSSGTDTPTPSDTPDGDIEGKSKEDGKASEAVAKRERKDSRAAALRAKAQQRADQEALGDLSCLFEQMSTDGRSVTASQLTPFMERQLVGDATFTLPEFCALILSA